uniref:Uncharacterized protein n=1 Tax=Cacopsylla melanoneura TaxID=428564 RepID=A0A8D9C140_9HEMI
MGLGNKPKQWVGSRKYLLSSTDIGTYLSHYSLSLRVLQTLVHQSLKLEFSLISDSNNNVNRYLMLIVRIKLISDFNNEIGHALVFVICHIVICNIASIY